MLKRFLQMLKLDPMGSPSQPASDTATGESRSSSAPPIPSPPASGSTQPAERTGGLAELSVSALQAQRQSLDRQQRATFDELQGLQADCQGVVARFGTARVKGRPAELQALARLYGNVKARLKSTELRHSDQLRLLTLLDRVCVLREDLQARQCLEHGAMAGLGLDELKTVLGDESAALLSNRSKVQDLLDELEANDEDAQLQMAGSARSAHEELMALTETEVMHEAELRLSPLSDLVGQIEQRATLAAGTRWPQGGRGSSGQQEATP